MIEIDAQGVYYKRLNDQIHKLVQQGEKHIVLHNINGQRYIGDGVPGEEVLIEIFGVPGNDLATFMDGPTLLVHNNAQDGIANTMNAGKVVIEGNAGDVLGYGMRGGKLFVQGDVGYRVGIHMKEYQHWVPILVAGGTAGDFFGEYIAGGRLILLGMNCEDGEPLVGDYVGTGMHGGKIFLRGNVEERFLGKGLRTYELDDEDHKELTEILKEYCEDTGWNYDEVMNHPFVKLIPYTNRPYGNLYVY